MEIFDTEAYLRLFMFLEAAWSCHLDLDVSYFRYSWKDSTVITTAGSLEHIRSMGRRPAIGLFPVITSRKSQNVLPVETTKRDDP